MNRVNKALNERIDKAVRRSQAQLDATYAKHPSLAPTPAQIVADRLRAQANAIEDAENEQIMREHLQKRI